MPTLLPARESQARTLSWPETVRFFVLLARVRWLDWRLHAAGRRTRTDSSDKAGDRLLTLARRWLALHARISALLGIPEPPHVQIARVTLQPPPRRRVDSSTLT